MRLSSRSTIGYDKSKVPGRELGGAGFSRLIESIAEGGDNIVAVLVQKDQFALHIGDFSHTDDGR